VTLLKNVSFTIEEVDFEEVPVETFTVTTRPDSKVYLIPEAPTDRKRSKGKAPKVEPEGLVLGDNVRYYSNGWRIGRYDGMEKKSVLIMPVGKDRHIRVAEANVEPIEDVRGS